MHALHFRAARLLSSSLRSPSLLLQDVFARDREKESFCEAFFALKLSGSEIGLEVAQKRRRRKRESEEPCICSF
jgi:hypothetical protein